MRRGLQIDPVLPSPDLIENSARKSQAMLSLQLCPRHPQYEFGIPFP